MKGINPDYCVPLIELQVNSVYKYTKKKPTHMTLVYLLENK